MQFLRFCCANSRDGQSLDDSSIQHAIDPNSNEKIEKKLRLCKNVLIEFMKFEHSLGMKNVDIIKLIEMVLKQSDSNNEIPKKELQQTYNKVKEIKLPQLKKVLTQQFFFSDASRSKYDFSKIQLFNIMYSGGNEAYKANFFFKLVQSSQSGCINNGSTKLLKALEYMTIITSIVISDALLKDGEQFEDEADEIQFESLHQLYTTNHLIIKEFAQYINSALLFPQFKEESKQMPEGNFKKSSNRQQNQSKKYMSLKEFQTLMLKENLDYTLVRPNEMRQRFTEFVMRNQSKALVEQNMSMVQSEAFNFNNDSRVDGNRDKFKASLGRSTKKSRKTKELDGTQHSKSSKARKSKSKRREDSRDQIVQGAFGDSKHSQRESQRYQTQNRSGRQSQSLTLRQSSRQGVSFEDQAYGLPPSGNRSGQRNSATRNQSARQKLNTSQSKNNKSLGGTNRQSMIQDILEESDGYDEEIDRDMYGAGGGSYQIQSKNQHLKKNNFDIDKSNDFNSIKNYGYSDKDRSNLLATPKSVKPNNKTEQLIPKRSSTQMSQDYSGKINQIDISGNQLYDQGSNIDPDTMFQGNLLPSNYYMKNRNSNALQSRHSNIERLRATARKSQRSFVSSSKQSNNKPYKTLKQFLDDMFTEQFVQFTNQVKRHNGQNQVGEDIILLDRFEQNEQFVYSGSPDDPLQFPQNYAKRYPFQLREIFEYFQAVMKKRDLIGLLKGTLFSEKIINMYFKILEKMNLVQLSMDNYQRQQQIQETPDGQRNSISSNILMGTNTMKIQYLSTNFVRKLRLQNDMDSETPTPNVDLTTVDQSLLQYFNHDLILLPFFFDETDNNSEAMEEDPAHKHQYRKNPQTGLDEAICGCGHDKRTVLVSVKVLDNQVDLFDKEYRDHDNHDISNCVLHVMDVASKLQDIELNEELIDADIENVMGIEEDEEMIVTICYIAECFTFGREPDLENINIDYQRKHIADMFLSLLNFQ